MEMYILEIMMDNDGEYGFMPFEFFDSRKTAENHAWIRHREFMDGHADFEQEESLHHEKEDFLQAIKNFGLVVTSDAECTNRRVYRVVAISTYFFNRD